MGRDRFLGHVERCGAILHLIDATGEHAGSAYRTVRRELDAYGEGLTEKAEIVALSKVDAVDEDTLKQQRERLKRALRSYGPPLAEGEADAFGLNTAREPDGFAQSALKLGSYRKLNPGPIEEIIFFDHPSGRARIRMAMDWKAAQLPGGQTQ